MNKYEYVGGYIKYGYKNGNIKIEFYTEGGEFIKEYFFETYNEMIADVGYLKSIL